MRLSQAARKFNVSTETIVNYLNKQGNTVDPNPNTKLTPPQLELLTQEFNRSAEEKKKALQPRDKVVQQQKPTPPEKNEEVEAQEVTQAPTTAKEKEEEPSPPTTATTSSPQTGFRILGSITLPSKQPKNKFMQVTSSDQLKKSKTPFEKPSPSKEKPAGRSFPPRFPSRSQRPSSTQSQKKDFKTRRKHRKEKKSQLLKQQVEAQSQEAASKSLLKLTPFITAKELAGLMKKPVTDILGTCMELGHPVSINQRLDEETILFLGEHYDYQIQFISIEEEEKDNSTKVIDPAKLKPRAPIISVMGHVDHGKTSLLDSIRKTEVTGQEAGGITQHIGAYEVHTSQGKRIVFLDTPGHEAFTAMRARGAQLTDIAIIIVAADEEVMPQTKEAISHAQLAKVPIVIVINKVDKPGADPDRIKGQLADMDITVEELGGTYQCQELSAKTGEGIPELLEKLLLEAELLTLKADPSQEAQGTVIEASLDRGKGYLANLMIQEGSLKKGDVMHAGSYFGKVKAMFNSHGQKITEVAPATPVQVLGLNGAPQAGESFKVMPSEKEARELAARYQAIRHQQSLLSKKKVITTLEDIINPLQGAQQLNIIIKADVDGSVEVLADSLLSLSTPEVKIDILHQAVGPISESDVLLASTSKSHIIGFHTKVASQVKKIAAREKVDIQLYNLIHEATQAIEELINHRTEPQTEEVIHGHGTLIQIFRIKGVGVVAGCRVKKGVIRRNSQVRIIRNDEILYQGPIKSLKIETEDVKEAREGLNCGFNLRNFDDLKVDDKVEAFEVKEGSGKG